MLLRAPYKSVVRQYQPRASRLYNHLQRLFIFTTFVIFFTICKNFTFSETKKDPLLLRCDPLAETHHCSWKRQNETSNLSDIMVGGLKLKKDECLISHLMSLPEYASELCRNVSDNCTDMTCLNVLTGSDLERYKSFIDLIPANSLVVHERNYPNVTRDCEKYKREAGFTLTPLDEESRNFPIAFNILVHNGVSQFELLLKTLYRPQNSFCIHVDNKTSPDFQDAVRSIASCFDNVFLASKSLTITWAGFNRLQADITCMKDQLLRGIDWKYLINSAAQAFPLRTVEEMVRILDVYNGANDIEGIYGKRILKSRFENEWLEQNGAVKRTGKKNPRPPHDIDIVRGSAYGVFSRNFVHFIVNDRRAHDLLQWARKTWSPDEFYWSTLHHTYSNPHLRTPGGFPGYPSDKKWMAVYANWGEAPCSGRRVRGVCVNGVKDVHRLIGRKEFFVNKFYQDLQPLTLSCLSAWLKYKQDCRTQFDDTFYRNLNFINKTR